MSESAIATVIRPITAAAGVFAPGHVGELTQYLLFELVDDVLAQTKTMQRRRREVGNHFIILLGQAVLERKRSEVALDELTHQMAGGDELTELSHELHAESAGTTSCAMHQHVQ